MKKPADFEGLNVALTGGANGIGRAIAEELASLGARVTIGDIHGGDAASAAVSIGHECVGRQLDVRDPASFGAFLDAVEEANGPLDMLINNAGVDWMGAFHEEAYEVSLRQIEVNLMGVINGTRLALQRMLPRDLGRIVNVASAAGRSPQPGSAVYTASKFGVVGLTECLRLEYVDSGVEFSLVEPGQVRTAMMDGTHAASRLLPVTGPKEAARDIVSGIRAGKFEIFTPKSQAVSVKLANFTPRPVRERVLLALRVQDIAGKSDPAKRADYIRRAFDR